MNKNILITTVLMMSISLFACTKKSSTTTPVTPTNTACNGMNLCFDLDGVNESHDAKMLLLNGRQRVYWEEGTGNTYKNIELDVYGSTTGTYNISPNPQTGDAAFQYYITNGNKNIQGQSGTVEVTAIDGTMMSGKFTITASDNGTTYQIANGNFVNVPL